VACLAQRTTSSTICLYNMQLLVACLVGDHFLLRYCGPYGIIFMCARVIITVVMIMLLRDLGPYGIIFMSACVITLDFPVILDG
jgi:uncharacterized YccA/Bax inhibitor family protein